MLSVDEHIAAWDTRFNEFSYNNPVYARLCHHLLLGQVLRNQKIIKHGIKIDGRFSFFLVQSSGSGKSTALGFVIDKTDALGLSFNSITDWSDAALIGTIEQKEEEKGKTSYEKVEGLMGDADILHIDEASLLFTPSKYNQSTLSHLQIALNPIGSPSNRITKKLAHGDPITVYPHLSLFLTSYNPTKVSDLVANRGIMQRMAIYVRFLNSEDRLANAFKDIEYLGVDSVDKEDLEDSIRTTLQAISDHYEKEENKIEFDMGIKPMLKNYAKKLHDVTINVNPYIQEQINSFLPRYLTMMYVIAMHHAAMRLSSLVEKDDVNYAYKLTKVMFDSVVAWLESEMELTSKVKVRGKKQAVRAAISIFDANQKGGKMSLPKFIRLIEEKTGRSKASVYRDLKSVELNRYLLIDMDGKSVRRKGNGKEKKNKKM